MTPHTAIPTADVPPPGSVVISGALATFLWACAALVASHATIQCCVGRDLTMMVLGGLGVAYCTAQAVFAAVKWARAKL